MEISGIKNINIFQIKQFKNNVYQIISIKEYVCMLSSFSLNAGNFDCLIKKLRLIVKKVKFYNEFSQNLIPYFLIDIKKHFFFKNILYKYIRFLFTCCLFTNKYLEYKYLFDFCIALLASISKSLECIYNLLHKSLADPSN